MTLTRGRANREQAAQERATRGRATRGRSTQERATGGRATQERATRGRATLRNERLEGLDLDPILMSDEQLHNEVSDHPYGQDHGH